MEKVMIECRGLCKTYRVAKREAGFGNAVKALFSREYELVCLCVGACLCVRVLVCRTGKLSGT